MLYKITVSGCDDSTVFTMDLTEEEYKVVERVALICTATSTCICMPDMRIEKEEQRD